MPPITAVEHATKEGPPPLKLELVDTHIPTDRSIGKRLTPGGDPMIPAKAKLLPEYPTGWNAVRDGHPTSHIVVSEAVGDAIEVGDLIVSRDAGGRQSGAMRVVGRLGANEPQSHTPGHFNGKAVLLARAARDTVTLNDENGERNAAARRVNEG